MISGTMRIGKIKVGDICLDIFLAVIKPILLHYQIIVSKYVRSKILKQKNPSLESAFLRLN